MRVFTRQPTPVDEQKHKVCFRRKSLVHERDMEERKYKLKHLKTILTKWHDQNMWVFNFKMERRGKKPSLIYYVRGR